MSTGLLARMQESGAVTEPVSSSSGEQANLQQIAEANLNEVLAAAFAKEVAEALPPVEAAIAKANRVCALPE